MDNYCYIHTNRPKTTYCDKSKKNICEEDTRRISSGIGNEETVMVYCPNCYSSVKKENLLNWILYLVAVITFGIIVILISIVGGIGFF
ncbi:MAG: hypothetical protein HeimC3_13970 [Candidatus Heimdallarchaeota archaeon LC_3]|nr:MAG: hypothetical protein HeimC3_13970 [Candidatus Heimdallarchaeota archaeon LC_3]